jgi:hypothetical protein
MIFASPHNEKWDYEWNYANGIPMTEAGWELFASGSGECSFTNSGQALKSATNNSYRCLRNPDRFNVPSGVMEVTFYAAGFSPPASAQNMRLCLANGANGIQINTSGGVIRLMNNATPGNCTSLGATLNPGQIYTITLTLQNNMGSVTLDGELLISGVDTRSIVYSTNTSIWSQNSNGNFIYIQRVKLKLNRI